MGRWWYLQWILEVVKIETPARKMKDGTEVKEQPMKHRITSKGTKATLDILECSTADAGQYALIVSNKKGDSKSAFSLNV